MNPLFALFTQFISALFLFALWLAACPVLSFHLARLVLPGAGGALWDWLALLSVAALMVLTVRPGPWPRALASAALMGYLASVRAAGWPDLYIDLVTGDVLRPHVLEAALAILAYGWCLFMGRTRARAAAGEGVACSA